MFILQVILIMEIVRSLRCEVLVPEDEGQTLHSCTPENNYLTGLVISDPTKPVRELKCSRPPTEWDGRDTLDEYPHWSLNRQWLLCSSGYFMNGFFRLSNVKERKWDITLMTRVRCVKPASHPVHYGDCFIYHLPQGVNNNADCSMKKNHFMVGIHATSGISTQGLILNSLKCCTMAQKPHEVHTLEQLQERIMATKLTSLAELADGLGFMYCAGVKGKYCGDDYRHDGNHWNAEERDRVIECKNGHCAHKRLHIFYDEWKLVVKNISYGESSTNSVELETKRSSTLKNDDPNTEVKQSFEIAKTVQETITHSTTRGDSRGHELSIDLKFTLPEYIGVSGSHKVTFQLSRSETNQTATLSSRTYKKINQITLKPLTAARYNVTVSQSKTVIPYTATVIATFSVRFEGTLRGASESYEGLTNFHHLYQRESKNQHFNYTFGDKNIPFYRALKTESEAQYEPWLWKEMQRQRPNVRQAIKDLIDERSYEFSLTGNLEYTSGTKIDVKWETVQLIPRGKGNSNGPNAKPVPKKKISHA